MDVRDASQDAGVQFSVTLNFQPRIAPGGPSQLGHNHSPSPVHHSMGEASLMVARHTVQGPRCPGGRRQAEVDTVYCEVCGGREPQASGELMDLSEDDPWDQWCGCACGGFPGQTTTVFPSSLAVRRNPGVLRFLGEGSMAHREFTRTPINPTARGGYAVASPQTRSHGRVATGSIGISNSAPDVPLSLLATGWRCRRPMAGEEKTSSPIGRYCRVTGRQESLRIPAGAQERRVLATALGQ